MWKIYIRPSTSIRSVAKKWYRCITSNSCYAFTATMYMYIFDFIAGRKLKLFISYGREEVTNGFAVRLHGDLEKKGYEPTLDVKDFLIGDSLSGVISQGIANCDAMIVILSNKYSKSSWCNDELIFAKNSKKKLFIIKREEDCDLSHQVKYQIGDIIYATVTQDEKYDDEIENLVKALEKVNNFIIHTIWLA